MIILSVGLSAHLLSRFWHVDSSCATSNPPFFFIPTQGANTDVDSSGLIKRCSFILLRDGFWSGLDGKQSSSCNPLPSRLSKHGFFSSDGHAGWINWSFCRGCLPPGAAIQYPNSLTFA